MVHALLLAAETEKSKTAFYIVGAVFAAWAIVLAALGLSRPDFPGNGRAARGVMGLSLALAVGSIAAAVATS
jgi:hypothetical protein